ncbi:hypothetical protein Tco_0928425, partial [Tanacetum coccineum]
PSNFAFHWKSEDCQGGKGFSRVGEGVLSIEGLRKPKQTEHDLDHIDLDGLDLENRFKKLEEDFSRMPKAKNAKEAKEAKLKMNEDPELLPQDQELSLLPLPQDLELSLLPFLLSNLP